MNAPDKDAVPRRLGLHLLVRRGLVVFGGFLIFAGIPVGILTPIPGLPIGLGLVVAGAALVARNSVTGKRQIANLLSAHPRIHRLTPDWLQSLVFGNIPVANDPQSVPETVPQPDKSNAGPQNQKRHDSTLPFILLWSGFAVFALIEFLGAANGMDSALAGHIRQLVRPLGETPLLVITSIGDGTNLVIVAMLCVAGLAAMRVWMTAILTAGAFLLNVAAVFAVKAVISRARPEALYSGVDVYSFPSGHAAHSALILTVLACLVASIFPPRTQRLIGLSAVILIVLIGVTRIALNAHWPSDVVGGWILAAAFASFLVPRFLRIEPSPERRLIAGLVVLLCVVVSAYHGISSLSSQRALYAPALETMESERWRITPAIPTLEAERA